MFTTLYMNWSDAQGQITLELVVVFGRNLNSSKLSCMFTLPARMRMIESKMKELDCSQDFSHYKSMGIFSRRSKAANSEVLALRRTHQVIWYDEQARSKPTCTTHYVPDMFSCISELEVGS